MGNLTTRVIRTREEIEDIRDLWVSWQSHPNSDIDFYLTVQRLRPTILRPHVIVVYNDGRPEAMLVGRIEHRNVECSIGYKRIFNPLARVMRFVYGGQLGSLSEETAQAAVKEVVHSLHRGEADLASFSLMRWDSPLCNVAQRMPGILGRDYLPSPQKHWSMTLGNAAEWQLGISRKLRKNQRWKKLARDFPDRLKIDYLRRLRRPAANDSRHGRDCEENLPERGLELASLMTRVRVSDCGSKLRRGGFAFISFTSPTGRVRFGAGPATATLSSVVTWATTLRILSTHPECF